MRQLLQRLLHSLLLLAAVSAFSFLLLSLAPGNSFDELKLDPRISPQTVAALKAEYSADRPLPLRYFRWLASALRGDFGRSVSCQCDVSSLIWWRARNTVLLTFLATLLAWALALPWGALQALLRGGWFDRGSAAITATLLAIPELLLALLLLLLASRTGWFPTGGMLSLEATHASAPTQIRDIALHIFLPSLALILGAVPVLVRHVRVAMIAAFESPFIEAARGLGIPRHTIVLRYAFPAAANSLISLLGFSIGALTSLSLLAEIVLSWPGLGPLVLEAVLARDANIVIAAVMLSSVFLVIGNLIADLLLYCVDPRIRMVQA